MVSVSDICEAVGRPRLMAEMGVKKARLSQACADNQFSARHYFTIKRLCDEVEQECPASLFSFVESPDETGAQQ